MSELKNKLMGNKNIACNYCGKPQCVDVPYDEDDAVAELYGAAKAFLNAVELHNQAPFDCIILSSYNQAKKRFIHAFDLGEGI